ncbi:MAG: sigma-70 family RNA polymerase sigma factor [Planctomycetota bacterium]
MEEANEERSDAARYRGWIQAVFLEDVERPDVHFMLLVFREAGSEEQPRTDASRHAEDHALVQAALSGDVRATEALASRLGCIPPMVRSLHRRFGGNLDDEDLLEVTQDVLASIWRKLDRFEGRSKLETWAYGFASRQVLKGLERARKGPRRVDWNEEEAADLQAPVAPAPDEYRAVHEHVEALGPPGSEIIRMKHFEELTFEQIGGRLDMPTNTVKTRYYRGLDRLRRVLSSAWEERRV